MRKLRNWRTAITSLLYAGISIATMAIAPIASATGTLHFASNTSGNVSGAAAIGINMFDVSGSKTNPTSINTTVNALPTGAKALIWVGNLDNTNCSTPGFTWAQFTAQVDALKTNTNVFGYFLSDEPHPGTCTSAAADIKARADYIHTNAPGQAAFITIVDGSNACGTNLGCEYNALQPSNTDVDYFGLDPYPCHYNSSGVAVPCDLTLIDTRINTATSNGIPAGSIVPVFQTFGQEGRTDGKTVYYRTPSATELQSMLDRWSSDLSALSATPVWDYSYTWGVQCGTSCPAPQALSNNSALQTVMATHNQ